MSDCVYLKIVDLREEDRWDHPSYKVTCLHEKAHWTNATKCRRPGLCRDYKGEKDDEQRKAD